MRRRTLLALLLAAVVVAAVLAVVLLRDRDRGHAPPDVQAGPTLPTVFNRPRVTRARPARPGQVGVGAQAVEPTFVPGRLLVKFEEGTSAQAASEVLDQVDGEVESRLRRVGVRVVEVAPGETAEALEHLADSPAVEYVERDVLVERFDTNPNDSLWQGQWGPQLVRTTLAWDASIGSPSVVIAIVDTGVNAAHPDLKDAVLPGYDFVNGDADASDDHGHGTSVAGVTAARTNNGEGQAGICWTCSLLPVKVLDAKGSGDTSTVAKGIVWATDNGARVINLSLGSTGTTQTLAEAVAYAAGKGVILVGAAGNSGVSTPAYPAAYPEVISVAATTQTDALYSWSNFGPWVQLAAPGCNTAPSLQGGYVNFCGTSSATPLVAGLVGLVLAGRPGATRDEVTFALRTGPVPVANVSQGRVDARNAFAALGISAKPAPAPAPTTTAPTTTAPAPPAAGQPEARAPRAVRPSTATFQGALGPPAIRVHRPPPEGGLLAATLTFASRQPLTLTLLNGDRVVTRVQGRSPLRLTRPLAPGGRYLIAVGGAARKTTYVLSVARG